MRLIKHDEYIKELLAREPKFREEYEKWDPAFEIAQMLIEARVIKGLTQARLAEMISTKQQSVARVESGKHLPSLSFLVKIAKALGTFLVVRFGFMEAYKFSYDAKVTHTHTQHDDIEKPIKSRYGTPATLSVWDTRPFATA